MSVKDEKNITTVTIECDHKTCDRTIKCEFESDIQESSVAIRDQLLENGWMSCPAHACPEHAGVVIREGMTPENVKKRINSSANLIRSVSYEITDNQALREETFKRIIERGEECLGALREMFCEDPDPAAHLHTQKGRGPFLGDVCETIEDEMVGRPDHLGSPIALKDILQAYLG